MNEILRDRFTYVLHKAGVSTKMVEELYAHFATHDISEAVCIAQYVLTTRPLYRHLAPDAELACYIVEMNVAKTLLKNTHGIVLSRECGVDVLKATCTIFKMVGL